MKIQIFRKMVDAPGTSQLGNLLHKTLLQKMKERRMQQILLIYSIGSRGWEFLPS